MTQVDPQKLVDQVQATLAPDEVLVWAGMPDPSVVLTASDVFLIPFSIAFCGFAFFWEAMAFTIHAPVVMVVFGVPFVLIGLYLVVGRFPHKRRMARRTVYALTTRRIISVSPRSRTELAVRGTPFTVRRARNGRHASVAFGRTWVSDDSSSSGGHVRATLIFHDVAEPDPMLQALYRLAGPESHTGAVEGLMTGPVGGPPRTEAPVAVGVFSAAELGAPAQRARPARGT